MNFIKNIIETYKSHKKYTPSQLDEAVEKINLELKKKPFDKYEILGSENGNECFYAYEFSTNKYSTRPKQPISKIENKIEQFYVNVILDFEKNEKKINCVFAGNKNIDFNIDYKKIESERDFLSEQTVKINEKEINFDEITLGTLKNHLEIFEDISTAKNQILQQIKNEKLESHFKLFSNAKLVPEKKLFQF